MKAKLKTYLTNLQNGLIKTKTDMVLQLIVSNPNITIHHIRNMGISHQTATGVISVLMDEGIVYSNGELKIKNRHYSMLMYESNEMVRVVRAEIRLLERYKNWVANIKEFENILGAQKVNEIMQLLNAKS